MCGITGFVDFTDKLSERELINATVVLEHRGPDSTGVELLHSNNAVIGMGHRRLSIIDISSDGNQPMYSNDRSVVITFNGEIYNFREIRKELEKYGHHFSSNSDTEVIIKAYQQYGIDCLHHFIGMFAIALFDINKQQFFLIRDRAGVKPLYYSFYNDCLLYASELKSFHQLPVFKKEISEEAVSLFFKYGYIPAPYSIYKDTYKLEPGHYAIFDLKTHRLELKQYWNITDYYNMPALVIDEQEAAEQLNELFISAFNYRMVSDVEVGVFLSGGYDSSLVTSIIQRSSSSRLKTFTIGFAEKKYNEAVHAKKIAAYLGTDHNEYYCTPKEAQEIIPQLPCYYDEPFGDSSAIPTILVSRFARKQVTVVLSADGGDELFAGYNKYDQLLKLKRAKGFSNAMLNKVGYGILKNLPGGSVKLKKIAQLINAADAATANDILFRVFMEEELSQLRGNKNSGNDIQLVNRSFLPKRNDFINTMLAIDYQTYLPGDILTKVDRATMSVGLEGREPLLDHRIAEWAAQLPSSLKYYNGDKKFLLKKVAHRYLPKEIMDRPKMGFGVPISEWGKEPLKDYIMQHVNSRSFSKHGYINGKYAEHIRDLYLSGKNGYENKVWLMLMFQLWWEKWN